MPSTGQEQQIAAPFYVGADDPADEPGIVRGEIQGGYTRTQRFRLLGKDRGEAIFDETMVDLVAGDHETHARLPQRSD